MARHGQQCEPLNCPEENDETLSEDFQSGLFTRFLKPKTSPHLSVHLQASMEAQLCNHQHDPACSDLSQFPRDPFCRYDQHAPYPSRAEPGASHAWHYKSPGGCYPNSLPSYLPSADYQSYPGADNYFPNGSHSLPGPNSPSLGSLEQPGSLHSFPPAAPPMHHGQHASPFLGLPHSPLWCAHYGPNLLQAGPLHHHTLRPGYHLPHGLTGPGRYRHAHTGSFDTGHDSPHPRPISPSTGQLSQDQRKVFVTYESDNEGHLKEVINFVALLRSNGFDTHIDVFEQQLNSISKIDCMERYLNEKDYLIIIIISQKYFETVTGAKMSLDNDERTSNTVYIHKQLQSEFIQNGCKNFRFIPVLFPGAKKSYVPSWLQHTHVYRWPRDRDDILRRLMRVEKYNPPPVGALPTIVSVPI
ncbi:uncharacterized protein traf3ip2b [Brachyhypopomus gauderio]|uniref:uncharacterized protein traf3ip2b n=1 Tax=Brachyhypopomus gauderio TaxID=698409 RepID=UPI0040429A17